MNIDKIDNGYTFNYYIENKPNEGQPEWDVESTRHTYAFKDWADLVDWIGKNEGIVQ